MRAIRRSRRSSIASHSRRDSFVVAEAPHRQLARPLRRFSALDELARSACRRGTTARPRTSTLGFGTEHPLDAFPHARRYGAAGAFERGEHRCGVAAPVFGFDAQLRPAAPGQRIELRAPVRRPTRPSSRRSSRAPRGDATPDTAFPLRPPAHRRSPARSSGRRRSRGPAPSSALSESGGPVCRGGCRVRGCVMRSPIGFLGDDTVPTHRNARGERGWRFQSSEFRVQIDFRLQGYFRLARISWIWVTPSVRLAGPGCRM